MPLAAIAFSCSDGKCERFGCERFGLGGDLHDKTATSRRAEGLNHRSGHPCVTDPGSRSIPAPGIVGSLPVPSVAVPGIGSVPIAGQGFPKNHMVAGPPTDSRYSSNGFIASPESRQRAPGAPQGRGLGPIPESSGGHRPGLHREFVVSRGGGLTPAAVGMVHGLARSARGPASPRIFG